MPDTVTAPRPVTPVSILAAELTELCARLGETGDSSIAEKLTRIRDLASGLDRYVAAATTAESPALAELARTTRAEAWHDGLEQEMLSGHVEGQLLKFLVRMSSAVRVLEIGMFTGYSALAMAEALPDDGIVVACEIDPAAIRLARTAFEASGIGHRIRIEQGPALDTLHRLAAAGEEPFDFVFIDADKSGYQGYLDALLDSPLLAPDAVIAVDNTLMQGQPWTDATTENGTAIAGFTRALAADPRTEQVLIPVRDGLTLIRPVTSTTPR
ncbi:methyltransferase domain-containing protein [Mycolicibacterium sp. 018/SC-01/001]|uniref:O-methyltransferase n=1 Tax=Mycolicibacterium sp. 018/SC-01/001 TaxID=2592069 RepID=UPI00117C7D50|nr:class I SAM-dependent methyltransferase [Mycolicibacterium sp. 018/SC-01/001]TRW87829.1 methyltransferase domain-containing protein [Mycolicibacterium sp. 018/SC-01/001]